MPPPDYSQHVSEIQTALKYGNPTAEDAFQAEVCLSWLYWTLNEPDLAISQLPGKLEDILDHLALEEGVIDGWTHVCIVKGAYIRG